MRITKPLIGILLAILFTIGLFSVEKVNADNLRDKIEKSIQETEERKEALRNFHEKVHKKFDEAGYDAHLSYSNDPLFYQGTLEVIVQVKDSELKKQRDKIAAIVKETAEETNFGKVTVRLKPMPKHLESEEEKKRRKLNQEIFELTKGLLDKKGYSFRGMIISSEPEQKIEIEIDQADDNLDKGKLEKLIHDKIYTTKKRDFNVEIRERTESDDNEAKWMPTLQSVREEMMKNFKEVTGFAYSFHPAPLQIIIKTSLADNRKTHKTAAKMEKYVHTIIDIKREGTAINGKPYTVIIRDKNHNKLN